METWVSNMEVLLLETLVQASLLSVLTVALEELLWERVGWEILVMKLWSGAKVVIAQDSSGPRRRRL